MVGPVGASRLHPSREAGCWSRFLWVLSQALLFLLHSVGEGINKRRAVRAAEHESIVSLDAITLGAAFHRYLCWPEILLNYAGPEILLKWTFAGWEGGLPRRNSTDIQD